MFRREVHRTRPIFRNCYELVEAMLRNGTHIIVEQSEHCRSWTKTRFCDSKHFFKYTRIVRGCNVGLKAPDVNRLMSKSWKFKTSSEHIAKALDGLDVCRHGYKHVPCVGSRRPNFSKHYPPLLANKIIDAVKTSPVLRTSKRTLIGNGRPCQGKKPMTSTERSRKCRGQPIHKKRKNGRPRLGQKPMTVAERLQRWRARKKLME